MLIALGLLLFFHREWWLQVAVNRALIDLGLSKPYFNLGRSRSSEPAATRACAAAS